MSRSADVVVPVYRNTAVTQACLESLLAHTGDECRRIVVIDDASPEVEMRRMLEAMRQRSDKIVLMHNTKNLGFVQSANLGIAAREADVVLLNSDTEVTQGWLAEMLEVAYSSDRVAAVSPLSNNGHFSSVPEFLQPNDPRSVAYASVDLGRLPRWSSMPTAVGFCLLLRDVALRILGCFDPAYGRGYNEENDWLQRARVHGFEILRANHAFVRHVGAVSFGEERHGLDARNTGLLVRRYPRYFLDMDAYAKTTRAQVASHGVRRQLEGLSVAIDLRGLHGEGLEQASALARALAEVPGLRVSQALTNDSSPTTQICHRLAPLSTAADLGDFVRPGSYAVLSVGELVTPESAAFAPTYAAMKSAQAILAPSERLRRALIGRLLLPEGQVHYVPPGVDTAFWAARADDTPSRPGEAGKGRAAQMVCVTSAAPRENLRWLLASYGRLRDHWKDAPELVLASRKGSGGRSSVSNGITMPPGVRILVDVDDAGLRQLLGGAAAYITAQSCDGPGPGLLEAMAVGLPILCPGSSDCAELAGEAALLFAASDEVEMAKCLTDLMSTPSLSESLSRHSCRRASAFSWPETAKKVAGVYETVVDSPSEHSLLMRQTLAQLVSARE